MPALSQLQERLTADPSWKTDYETSCRRGIHWAEKMPLLHTFAPKASSPKTSFLQLVVQGEKLQVSTPDPKSNTFKAEEAFKLGRCLYFYAGRAYNREGGVTLLFHPDVEKHKEWSASPFDTGGLFCRDSSTGRRWIQSNLMDDDNVIFSFIVASTIDSTSATSWRSSMHEFSAAYFTPLENYFSERPCQNCGKGRLDPEEIFAVENGNSWRAWTWEIRFHAGLAITAAAWWCGSKQQMSKYKEGLKRLPLSQRDSAARGFLSIALDKKGSLDYISKAEKKALEIATS